MKKPMRPQLRVPPGSDGRIQIGIVEYEDPYPDRTKPADAKKELINAPANIRCDVFHYLRYSGRKSLLEDHQWAAGQRISMLLLPVERTARALNTAKEPVDGGGGKLPSLALVDSFEALAKEALEDFAVKRRYMQKRVRDEIGRSDFEFIDEIVQNPLVWILWYDMLPHGWQRKKATDKIVRILDKLAGCFGYATKDKSRA